MTNIAIIVAIDKQNGIGKNNQLLCHLPNDLKHFKQLTSGHTIIMGRKTFESLPNGALPNRKNIVITRNQHVTYKDCEIAYSLDDAISKNTEKNIVFIIGGASIYEQAISVATVLYITKIDATFDADTFFPHINKNDWTLVKKESHQKDDKNPCDYTFETWVRKTSSSQDILGV